MTWSVRVAPTNGAQDSLKSHDVGTQGEFPAEIILFLQSSIGTCQILVRCFGIQQYLGAALVTFI